MPRSIRLEYKSCCCNLVSVLGWFILSSTHELMWMWEWELSLENVCALIEYEKKWRGVSTFLFFFYPPLDQLCWKERQVRLLFFFDLLPLSEWNEHWKFLPLIITATKSLSLFFLYTSHMSCTHTTKGGTQTVEKLPENNMRSYCTQTPRQAQGQINTHILYKSSAWSQQGRHSWKANPEVCRWCRDT